MPITYDKICVEHVKHRKPHLQLCLILPNFIFMFKFKYFQNLSCNLNINSKIKLLPKKIKYYVDTIIIFIYLQAIYNI